MSLRLLGSLARITDFDSEPYDTTILDRAHWATGDYVVSRVIGVRSPLYRVELPGGRLIDVMRGDEIVGAFGVRVATLECVGSWRDIHETDMQMLTSAGLFGQVTSVSSLVPPMMQLRYVGHATRCGEKLTMSDFLPVTPRQTLRAPVVLLAGTSMSAGKTIAGRLIVHELARAGLRVVGTKLTGAGRYRDVLSFRDAGASEILDFVDAGMPTTACPESEFLQKLQPLLSRIAALRPDVVVAEAGASPLEPYNGAAAIAALGTAIRCTVLCASDPYAVVGARAAFGVEPDLVAGPAGSTTAAVALVRKLTGLKALDTMDADSIPALRHVLERTLGLKLCN